MTKSVGCRVLVTAAAFITVAAVGGCTSTNHTTTPQALSAPTTGSTAPAGPAGDSAAGVQSAFESIVGNVLPSVVQITTSGGLGSGVIFDKAGDIVTNAHVVGQSTTFQVTLATNGTPVGARLVATYPPDDLAVIRLNSAPSNLKVATFGDSAGLRPGALVLALGNPLGLSGSVTNGYISATGRTVSEPQSAGSPGATIADAIQTSASINPGNSGGALVDLSGHVIGIPTLAATDPEMGGAAPGIGFAIPSNTVQSIASQIVKNGKVVASQRAALDITARTIAGSNGQPVGVGVVRVSAGGAAAKAGVVPGDTITAINNTATPTTVALSQVLANLKPGDRVTLHLVHANGSTGTAGVTLGQLR
jgi:S1-C subfamily serine protease